MTSGDKAFDNIPDTTHSSSAVIELPLIITDEDVIFPQREHKITILDALNEKSAQAALAKSQNVIIALAKQSVDADNLLDHLHAVGTETTLTSHDRFTTVVQGQHRVELLEIVQEDPYVIVRARRIPATTLNQTIASRYINKIDRLFSRLLALNPHITENQHTYIRSITDPDLLADTIGALVNVLSPEERQQILEQTELIPRLEFVVTLLERKIHDQSIQREVDHTVQETIKRTQRETYLREQMRVIQEELGEDDLYQQELNELYDGIHAVRLPDETYEKAMKEFKRLSMMNPMMPEAPVIRTYIDWLISVPWKTKSRDNLDLDNAEKTLNEDHYGLEKIKDRILEHIAVRKLAKDKMKSPILCFVGPPGVGKTSLGQSIASALGRKFIRISLGGIRDEAEIRGHRRTYIGAMPGRIIQAMKRAGTINPVFMLDEIDKLTEDYRGDPAAALLEVLDPEQNHEFSDHYLEVPYDLSNVLFIATANELYPLPEALEDRLEIIEFRGYTEEEKLEIARRYLIPKQLKAHGIEKQGIIFQNDAITRIIRQYTMEAGVRNLEREIANVCRKITRLIATKKHHPKRITPNLVAKYLGSPYILESRVNREDLVGLVTGLVWTSAGGDIQLIEVSLLPGKGNLMLTGQLGDVLQESAQTALSYVRSRANEFDIPHDDFENYDIHIHMPEGSVPKDGPSAGITLAIALISAFTERVVHSEFAMTGEVTLRGHVLAIGGVKEKVLAARRNRIANVILPKANDKDLTDIPRQALKDLNIIFVQHMDEIIDLVLGAAPEVRQRDLDAGEEDDEGEYSAEAEPDNIQAETRPKPKKSARNAD